MRDLIEDGDPTAAKWMDTLTRVQDIAQKDLEMAVPDHAVRVVKVLGTFGHRRRRAEAVPSSALWNFLPFEVTFDSLLQPAMAGVRDLGPAYRKISFQAGVYSVDVHLEPDPDPLYSALTGQVLRTDASGLEPIQEVPVVVAADGRVVDRSLTSEFGEFEAMELPKTRLDLYVLLDDEECINVPLEAADG